MQIRHPTGDDVRAISEVHVASWQSAYKGLLPDELLASLSVERRERWWQNVTQTAPESILVAEENGRIVGFVNFGTTRDEDLDQGATGEIMAIYLLAEMWGCWI